MFDRARLCRARRVVVKIGSRTLASDPNACAGLARSIAAAQREHRSIVLVSSGAIALGTTRLHMRARPREMAKLQAAAAAGQTALMRMYEEAFGALGIPVAQVLLTHADLADRTRSNNARAALGALLEAGAVPILNENDSVSVEEIKFGDNDQLAALVTPLVDATLLVLLSDVDGLLDASGRRIPVIQDVVTEALPHVRRAAHPEAARGPGTGGMASKVEAARRAALAGADVVVADARTHGIVDAILRGDDVGTVFVASGKKLSAKRYWIAFTLRPRGTIVLDTGAAEAVRSKGRSILPVGVLGVRGDFRAGDAVSIATADGKEIGRGLARAGVLDAARLASKTPDRDAAKGEADVLVHRDDMAIW
jgi:glutamate 5-kinase